MSFMYGRFHQSFISVFYVCRRKEGGEGEGNGEEPKGKAAAKDKLAKKKTTGYVLFCQEFRPEVREDNPELPQVEITKLLAEMWKNLPEEEKEEWKEKAAAA